MEDHARPEIPDSLVDLVERAVEHAFQSIEKGGPLVPFVLSCVGDKLDLQRCVVGMDGGSFDLGASVERAKRTARSLKADAVAVAFDGRIALDGPKQDAILVEACERGGECTATFAMCYRKAGLMRKVKPTSGLILVAEDEPMWK
jgi:hypothetical protein